MPVIPVDLDSLKDLKPVPNGNYDLTCINCEEVQSKNDKPQYDMTISIDGHEDSAPTVRHFVSLPNVGDEPRASQFKALQVKKIARLFGLSLSGNELDTTKVAMQLAGRKAKSVQLTLDKETTADGKEKPGGRVFNRIVVPFMEDAQGGRTAPQPPKS